MHDLLISRVSSGVARISSVDPFDSFEIYRINRANWKSAPAVPGVYLLYGVDSDGNLTVYIGMSSANMRNRISVHHVNKRKNWFGTLFAIPIPNVTLCPAIEAELIGEVQEAQVADIVDNKEDEKRYLDLDDVHVQPALEKIREGLQLVLGNDIFTAQEAQESKTIGTKMKSIPKLARVYRGLAEQPKIRSPKDPTEATHSFVGKIQAWGYFIDKEPNPKFKVLAGSTWQRAKLNQSSVNYERQENLESKQNEFLKQAILADDPKDALD